MAFLLQIVPQYVQDQSTSYERLKIPHLSKQISKQSRHILRLLLAMAPFILLLHTIRQRYSRATKQVMELYRLVRTLLDNIVSINGRENTGLLRLLVIDSFACAGSVLSRSFKFLKFL